MSDSVREYLREISKNLSLGNATEHTHRPALKTLIEAIGDKVVATNEPRRVECGAPDFVVQKRTRHGPLTIGYIEAKDVDRSLDEVLKDEQLKRYLTLPNLILTDYLEFRWFTDGDHRQTVRLAHTKKDGKLKTDSDAYGRFIELIENFLAHELEPISKPKDLALRMAKLTHMIRDIIIGTFDKGTASDNLAGLRQAFAKVLIPDIDKPEKTAEFADMFAQTIAYGLFAARCNHDSPEPFRRIGAAFEIPRTNPFLRNLFEMVTGTALDEEPYAGFVDDLVQLLNHADIASILSDFGKRTRKEDPIVHFYETFLAAYDPKLREKRGVYYTPEPVVSYIVRSVDHILKTRFGLPQGLADTATVEYERAGEDGRKQKATSPRVLILDPACGTGTFLYSVVDHVRDEFMARGDAGMWSGYVRNHLLPRLFGFELLMAPYAVAHFKLGMQLAAQDLADKQRDVWAYDFSGDERLGIYLTNTLEEAEWHAETLFGPLRIITEEANAAAKIKRDLPILVVVGNPPYALYGMMNKGKWITDLISDWKPKGERKWNPDDFMKFIRWAQWRIEHTGVGVLAFITNNTYIDGITHRRMRQSLMETFTEIYILDLHGNSNKKERCPDGSKDENVFDIQQGVAIGIFIKEPNKKEYAKVFHSDLWGLRPCKYARLIETNIETTEWTELRPQADYFFFVPKDFGIKNEYSTGWELRNIFAVSAPGVKTERDRVSIHFTQKSICDVIRDFETLEEKALREKYSLDKDSRDWKVHGAKTDVLKNKNKDFFRPITYRPFDLRHTWYSGQTRGFIGTPGYTAMRHMLEGENVGIITTRQTKERWDAFVTKHICGHKSCAAYDINNLFPLYLYPIDERKNAKQNEMDVGPWPKGKGGRVPNLNPEFVEDVEKRLGLEFTSDGAGDLEKTFGPEDVLDYIYAVFHSPTYRERYAEFLKIDFPRVPLTSNIELFGELCRRGAELVALHLLESPKLSERITRYPVKGDDVIEKGYPKYVEADERVYINKLQYFEGVPKEVWEFHIGGYQVLQKWLKDRRGRTLSYEELDTYQKIVVALSETIRLMNEIDEAIEEHGGWPDAFSAG